MGRHVDLEWQPIYTRHQVPRGSRADAISGREWILIKAGPSLRLTYQIRLLAFGAVSNGSKLVLVVRKDCKLSAPLRTFVKANRNGIVVRRDLK
jgi:hypothetical protein